MKKILCFLALALCSCSEEKEQPTVPYFTVDIDPMFDTAELENWIIIHDGNGTFLDAKPYEGGQTLTFGSTIPPNEITISTLYSAESDRNIHIQSYVGQKPNSHWVIRKPAPTDLGGREIGNFQVSLSAGEFIPGSTYLTDRFAEWDLTDPSQEHFTVKKNIQENAKDLLLIARDSEGNARYKFFQAVEPGTYNLKVSDMNSFDIGTSINFPPSNDIFMMSHGMEAGTLSTEFGYRVNYFKTDDQNPQTISALPIGYLDWLPNYRIVCHANYPGKTLGYVAVGPRPEAAVTLEEIEASIDSRTFTDFSLSGNDYDYYTAQWSASEHNAGSLRGISWSVTGAANTFRKMELSLSAELHARFPIIKNAQLDFSQVTVTKSSVSFEEYMRVSYGAAPLEPFENWWQSMY